MPNNLKGRGEEEGSTKGGKDVTTTEKGKMLITKLMPLDTGKKSRITIERRSNRRDFGPYRETFKGKNSQKESEKRERERQTRERKI